MRGRNSKVYLFVLFLVVVVVLEPWWHSKRFKIQRTPTPLDKPFESHCGVIPPNRPPKQNATVLMLARNSDVSDAVAAVESLELHFNRWFEYPYLFVNNEPWSTEFIEALTAATKGRAIFATIPAHMWGFPARMTSNEKNEAQHDMELMKEAKVPHAGNEQYHHMCRFYSGFFYHLEEIQQYEWYLRIEPDSRFTCDVSYDPFYEMSIHNKTYGFTIALWEVGATASTLFRTVYDYILDQDILTSNLWSFVHEPSWAPWPVRRLLSGLQNRDSFGDSWNLCHFWSNFEIAKLSFFRSPEYRDFFQHLDESNGYYYERWGDAPVHSLAAAMFLAPEQLHFFSDLGYRHKGFQQCPQGGLGCRCDCENGVDAVQDYCRNRILEVMNIRDGHRPGGHGVNVAAAISPAKYSTEQAISPGMETRRPNDVGKGATLVALEKEHTSESVADVNACDVILKKKPKPAVRTRRRWYCVLQLQSYHCSG